MEIEWKLPGDRKMGLKIDNYVDYMISLQLTSDINFTTFQVPVPAEGHTMTPIYHTQATRIVHLIVILLSTIFFISIEIVYYRKTHIKALFRLGIKRL